MSRPRLFDLYCCQGGAAKGYHDAGFDVVGVDISPQPRYPFEFHQMSALRALDNLLAKGSSAYAAIHASPPCQAFTLAQRIRDNDHLDLIGETRDRLVELGLPYVIENVPGAPLVDPVELCGEMFGLRTYRHRLFESNVPLAAPVHPPHRAKQTKMGRPPKPGEYMQLVGHFSGVEEGKAAMGGLDWMTQDGLREAIPPAYTEHVGRQLMAHLERQAA